MTKRYFLALFAVSAITTSAAVHFAYPAACKPPATEARLIGECNGRLLAAMEESDFPAGCTWIELIRLDGESVQ